jgi:hypothetical protein
MNLTLRVAILKSVRTQTRLAAVTRIPEWRLSKIVNGWQHATPDEQQLISTAVGVERELLFQHTPDQMEALTAGAA